MLKKLSGNQYFTKLTIFLIYRACLMCSALYSVFAGSHNYIAGIQV